MVVRKQSNTVKQKFVELVMDQEQSRGQAPRLVMHVVVQACKLFDKVQSLCKQCVEFVKVRDE